jgi:ubiquinone/menaquinone biosynthesis C-methylase UbiE
MGSPTYIHGTDAAEQARLRLLNRLTNPGFLEFVSISAGDRVLDLGSGLGILAAAIADLDPSIVVDAVEISEQQIAAAERHPRVRTVRMDATQLDFSSASFDHVVARYLLEHVPRPRQVLEQIRRVLKPGGSVWLCENDISLIRFDPLCPAFEIAWQQFQVYQCDLGGDPLIGSSLHRLLKEAGFDIVALDVQPQIHWFGSDGYDDWVVNIRGNLESAAAGMLDSGRLTADQLQCGLDELDALRGNRLGSACFIWNRARATPCIDC